MVKMMMMMMMVVKTMELHTKMELKQKKYFLSLSLASQVTEQFYRSGNEMKNKVREKKSGKITERAQNMCVLDVREN